MYRARRPVEQTHIPREVFEHVWLEGHVDVDGADDVAELAVLDFEQAADMLRSVRGACESKTSYWHQELCS